MHVKKGGAVGGEWGETVIVRGGGGKELEVEEEEGEGGGGLWGVKLKRARCLGIFQFLRPMWCFLFHPRLALRFYAFWFHSFSLSPPKPPKGGKLGRGRKRGQMDKEVNEKAHHSNKYPSD